MSGQLRSGLAPLRSFLPEPSSRVASVDWAVIPARRGFASVPLIQRSAQRYPRSIGPDRNKIRIHSTSLLVSSVAPAGRLAMASFLLFFDGDLLRVFSCWRSDCCVQKGAAPMFLGYDSTTQSRTKRRTVDEDRVHSDRIYGGVPMI